MDNLRFYKIALVQQINPCQPSPCGPNSKCKLTTDGSQPVCTCSSEFIGTPPNCRPECTSSSECDALKACINRRCTNPCPGVCGQNAECQVRNHSPICACRSGFTGDAFIRCTRINIIVPNITEPVPIQPKNPCLPTPCGPNSQCKIGRNGQASCSCLPNYIGAPPTCRPECSINEECDTQMACINQKCADPCPGSCGLNTQCIVWVHTPMCTCLPGYTGDPFSSCNPLQKPPSKVFCSYLITSSIQ